MIIRTKYKIGDRVLVKNTTTWSKPYKMTINGIVIYKNSICYFEEYEEDNIEEDLIIEKIKDEEKK